MKALLDTHTFLWWVTDDPRLSAGARKILADGENTFVVSACVAWELVIKVRIGKLTLPDEPGRYIPDRMSLYAFEGLAIEFRHVLHLETLPNHHRDPFDRILIAQSLVEKLPILTADGIVSRYGVEVFW